MSRVADNVSAGGSHLPRTERPLIYYIDYTDQYFTDPSFVERFRDEPPDVVHVGKAVPITHHWGPIPTLRGENQYTGGRARVLNWDGIRLLSPDELKAKIEVIKAGVKRLHDVGVKDVMPYISCEAMAGDYEKRLGFWTFYDNWETYSQWLGPKPAEAPFLWLLRDAQGNVAPGACGGSSPPYYAPLHRYRVCMANPHWLAFHRTIVRLIAECGYDGVFVDNIGNGGDFCKYCQAKFKQWISVHYTSRQVREMCGVDDSSKVDLFTPMFPASEMKKYRFSVIADYLTMMREEGRKVKPGFKTFLNGGTELDMCMAVSEGLDLYMFESIFSPQGLLLDEPPSEDNFLGIEVVEGVSVPERAPGLWCERRTVEHRNYDNMISLEFSATVDYPRRCGVGQEQQFILNVTNVGIPHADADAAEELHLVLTHESGSCETTRIDFEPRLAIGRDSEIVKNTVPPPQRVVAKWMPRQAGRYKISIGYRYTDATMLATTNRIPQLLPLIPEVAYCTHIESLQALQYAKARMILLDYYSSRKGHDKALELGLAEFAAFSRGGGVAASGEPQRKHARFTRRNAALFEGRARTPALVRVPYGEAGVLFSYWGPNPGKMEKGITPTIAEKLSESHRLWAPLMDKYLDMEDLRDRLVVYAVCQSYEMSGKQVRALHNYVKTGGELVIEIPTATINGRLMRDVLGAAQGKGGVRTRALVRVRLWDLRKPHMPTMPIASSEDALLGLRFAAYVDTVRARTPALVRAPSRIILHAVNYNVSLGQKPDIVTPLERVEVALPLPLNCGVRRVSAYDPDDPTKVELEFAVQERCVRFTLPTVHIYRVVEVVLGTP